MILDTDVLIALGSPRCPQGLTRRMAETREPICTTTVTWAEISHGLARVSAQNARQLRERYEAILSDLAILDFDRPSAETFGRVRADLERIGQPLDNMDLMIASIALRHDLTLITGNTRHFSRVPGLRVENWLADEDGASY